MPNDISVQKKQQTNKKQILIAQLVILNCRRGTLICNIIKTIENNHVLKIAIFLCT